MSGRRKYALHAGWVRSKTDGDEHYITTVRLASLYQLRKSEYVIWTEESEGRYGLRYEDYTHLYPRYDGNYGRPE